MPAMEIFDAAGLNAIQDDIVSTRQFRREACDHDARLSSYFDASHELLSTRLRASAESRALNTDGRFDRLGRARR